MEPVKRLATLWLICAVIGFAVVAGLALTVSLTVDGAGSAIHAMVAAASGPEVSAPSEAGAARQPH